MSQLQVTGEAKIRDIQGPVVANSGVITALDGAANQYVRGDGTLAIFPTSTGGGSSVSYYLNGSVNQGTFGGSTYYQMSRNAIVGTGTNFSTSSDGLIAQFITDANDPDVVSIPSGNWNVEFFMNVSASSGALASFYVEIYKYNGSTFTLLATNVATPEQLTNTTTVDAYFTSVAMPLSAMAVTDRLAIRIFANVASKTVTLYTEDNRLCQIVTTFSNGLTSLNNLTDQSQYLTTGTSGTDFNIVSSGDTHTFNIPSASASNRGLITTGSQTIAGAKVFDNPITANSGIGFLNGVMPNITSNLYSGIGGNSQGISIITRPVSTNYTNNFYFPSASNSYTFPNATGTIALTSDISYPVTSVFGRTGAVVAASGDYTTTQVTEGTNLYFTDARARAALSATSPIFYNSTTGVISSQAASATLQGFVTTSSQTIAGVKTFSNGIVMDNGSSGVPLEFKQYASAGYSGTGFTSLFALNNSLCINFGNPSGFIILNTTTLTSNRTFTFQNASGTLALTSDLSAYLPLTGGTLTGALSGTSATFSSNVITNGYLQITNASNPSLYINNTAVQWQTYVKSNSNIAISDAVRDVLTLGYNGSASFFQGCNVGIGTSSPTSLLHLQSATAFGTQYLMTSAGGGTALTYRQVANETTQQLNMVVESNHPMVLWTNSTERMRITSGGSILFGTTTLSTTHAYFENAGSSRMVLNLGSSITTSANLVAFNNPNGNVGLITTNGTSTSYNTSSDYRLKEDLKEINGLEKVSAIKVYDFKWKADGSRMDGVIAHELQEVIPYAVIGQKDAEQMQQVDYSKLTPINTKAIQELYELVKEQQAQIEELKELIKNK